MHLIKAHGKVVFTVEGGTKVLEPKNIEDTDIERVLDIKI